MSKLKKIKLPEIDKKQKIILACKLPSFLTDSVVFISETKTKYYFYLWDGISKNPNIYNIYKKLEIDRIFQYDN